MEADSGVLEERLIVVSPRLLTYFVRRVPTKQDAEDLLGEVMVVAWRRAAHAPAETTALEMWLFGIARNTLGTFYRGQTRRQRLYDRMLEMTGCSRCTPRIRLATRTTTPPESRPFVRFSRR